MECVTRRVKVSAHTAELIVASSSPLINLYRIKTVLPPKVPQNRPKIRGYRGELGQAHNLKVVGSNPTPAPNFSPLDHV